MIPITKLKPHQIFVFGSNSTGFHGAGSAGQACRGDSKNTWRTDPWFLEAKNSPTASQKRIGKWAVYGQARGFQKGTEGMSYAIETIKQPGMRRSTPLSEIKKQLKELLEFCHTNPQYEILMTPVGCGYSGYSAQEMKKIWDESLKEKGTPKNLIAPNDLYTQTISVNLT
jgi:hypothetical protein